MSGGEPVRTLSKEILKQAYGNLGNKLYQLSTEEIAEKERLQKAKESRAERRRQLRCNQAEQESTRKLAEAEEAKRKLIEQEEEAKRKIMEEDEMHRRAHALLEEERKRVLEEAEKEKRKREEFELEALRLQESKLQQEADAQRLRKEREEQEQVQLSLMLSMVEERLRSEFAQEKQQIVERMTKDAQSLQQQAIFAQSKLDAMEHRNKQVAQEVVNADRIAAKLNGTTRDEPLFNEKDFAAPPSESKPSPPPLSEEEELKKKQREELAEQTALIQRNAVTAAYIWLNVGSRGVESVNRFFGKPIHTDGFHTRINTALAKGEFNHALKRLSQEQWAKEVLASPVGSIAGTFLNQLLSNHLDNVMTLEATGVCGYRQRAAEQTQQEMKAAAGGGAPPQPPPQQQATPADTTKHNVGCTCEKCLALYKHILDTQGKPHPTGCTCSACLAFYQRVLQSGTSSSSSSSSSTPLPPREESKVIEQLQQQCHMLQNQMEQQRTMYEQMQLQQEKALKERELLFQEQQKQFLTQLRQLSTEKQEQEKLQLQKELERLRQDQRNKEEKEAKEAKQVTEQLLKQQEAQAAKAREEKQQQEEDARRKKQQQEEAIRKQVEEEDKSRKQKEEADILQQQKKRAADEESEKLRLQKLKDDQEKEEQTKLQKQKQDEEKEKQGFRGFQGFQGPQGTQASTGISGNQEKLKEKEETAPSDSTPFDLSHLLASFRPVEPPILAEQPSTYGRCRYADHMDPTYESGARSASQERSFSRELVQKYHRHRSISPPASSSQSDVVVDPVSGKLRAPFRVTPRSRGVIEPGVLTQLQKHAYTFEPMFGMVPELMTFMNGGASQALTTSG